MSPLPGLLMAVALLGGCPQLMPAPDPKVAELIRQLGHKSYSVREAAAKALTSRGKEAIPALTVNQLNTDPQVAGRCRQLIPLIIVLDRNEKLARLLKEPAGPVPKDLAGAERFLKITGDTREARLLFAEMTKDHWNIIEALETDPEKAVEHWDAFISVCVDRSYQIGSSSFFTDRAGAALALFIRADGRLPENPDRGTMCCRMARATEMRKRLTGPETEPAFQKLFFNWLERERNRSTVDVALELAAKAGMKEIRTPLLRRIFDLSESDPYWPYLLIALRHVAGKEHLKTLKPYLAYAAVVSTIRLADGRLLTTQVRDVALGVCVQISGQKLADFGYYSGIPDKKNPSEIIPYSFPDDATRDKAFAKWKAWTEKEAAGK